MSESKCSVCGKRKEEVSLLIEATPEGLLICDTCAINEHRQNGGNTTEKKCALCDKAEQKVEVLVKGPTGLYICNNCITVCSEILELETKRGNTEKETALK